MILKVVETIMDYLRYNYDCPNQEIEKIRSDIGNFKNFTKISPSLSSFVSVGSSLNVGRECTGAGLPFNTVKNGKYVVYILVESLFFPLNQQSNGNNRPIHRNREINVNCYIQG